MINDKLSYLVTLICCMVSCITRCEDQIFFFDLRHFLSEDSNQEVSVKLH